MWGTGRVRVTEGSADGGGMLNSMMELCCEFGVGSAGRDDTDVLGESDIAEE